MNRSTGRGPLGLWTYAEMMTVLKQELFYLSLRQLFVTIIAIVVVGEVISSPIAKLLRESKIPFALTTGYDEQHPIDRVFDGAPRLKKPYDASAVRALIQSLSRTT